MTIAVLREQVKKAILYKTTDGRYLTLEEYKTANADKADKKVYYTNDRKRQAASASRFTPIAALMLL